MKLLHILGFEIDNIVLLADTLGRGVVLSRDELITDRALFQAWEHIEDTTLSIVKQEDTEVAFQILVPEGILIVEETQVPNDAEDVFVCHHRKTCCCREGAIDTIHATIAVDTMLGKDVRQSDGRAVGIVKSEESTVSRNT